MGNKRNQQGGRGEAEARAAGRRAEERGGKASWLNAAIAEHNAQVRADRAADHAKTQGNAGSFGHEDKGSVRRSEASRTYDEVKAAGPGSGPGDKPGHPFRGNQYTGGK